MQGASAFGTQRRNISATGAKRWGRDLHVALLGERVLDVPWLYRGGRSRNCVQRFMRTGESCEMPQESALGAWGPGAEVFGEPQTQADTTDDHQADDELDAVTQVLGSSLGFSWPWRCGPCMHYIGFAVTKAQDSKALAVRGASVRGCRRRYLRQIRGRGGAPFVDAAAYMVAHGPESAAQQMDA